MKDLFSLHISLAADTIFSVAYGLDVRLEGRESLDAAKEATHAMLNAAVPGRFLVDYIPFLKYIPEWVPGAKFQKLARGWKEITLRMIEIPFIISKAKLEAVSLWIQLMFNTTSNTESTFFLKNK